MIERSFGVWLYEERAGTLVQSGDFTQFSFDESYLADPNRPVLGLKFEETLFKSEASKLRLPPWFSNLLPEGRLRDWIAEDRHVSADREMELLAQVGEDLPGAVRVLPSEANPNNLEFHADPDSLDNVAGHETTDAWKFSLAGVALKFSMLRSGDRLTLPAHGQGGDWIVKLPDPMYSDVPRNEYTMMTLAALIGINTPERILVQRDMLSDLPPNVWKSEESLAYAVRRFDRDDSRSLIHIEDFAQVRGVYPYGNGKYMGNFETVGAIAYRYRHLEDLKEVIRRLVLNVMICNGDAHLKNWSLIYYDRKVPSLSPVYDVVSTSYYAEYPAQEDMGLKLRGSRRFDTVSLEAFERLGARLGVTGLGDVAEEAVKLALEHWPEAAEPLKYSPDLMSHVQDHLIQQGRTLLGTP